MPGADRSCVTIHPSAGCSGRAIPRSLDALARWDAGPRHACPAPPPWESQLHGRFFSLADGFPGSRPAPLARKLGNPVSCFRRGILRSGCGAVTYVGRSSLLVLYPILNSLRVFSCLVVAPAGLRLLTPLASLELPSPHPSTLLPHLALTPHLSPDALCQGSRRPGSVAVVSPTCARRRPNLRGHWQALYIEHDGSSSWPLLT